MHRRAVLAAVADAALGWAAIGHTAHAAQPYAGPLFDAHLHYNEEAFAPYPVADAFARMPVSYTHLTLPTNREV